MFVYGYFRFKFVFELDEELDGECFMSDYDVKFGCLLFLNLLCILVSLLLFGVLVEI